MSVRGCTLPMLPVAAMGQGATFKPQRILRGLHPVWPGLLATFVTFIVYMVTHLKYAGAPGSDGFYSWLFARSIALDGDIEFSNDYALCGDPYQYGIDRGTGHPDNPFYVGPAVYWLPVLTVIRWFVRLPASALPPVRFGCYGPIVNAVAVMGPICGAATVYFSYLIARRFAANGPAAFAAALFGLAGNITLYASALVHYSHVYDAMTLAIFLWAMIGASKDPASWWRWAVAGTALAISAMHRLPNVVFGLVPIVIALGSRDLAVKSRIARAALTLALGALGVMATLSIYKYLYGSFFVVPQGRHYVQLRHAHPFLTLFAIHGGLFFTTPIVWLSVVGFGLALRSRDHRPLAATLAVIAALTLYVASAPLDWHGNATFGARRLVVLTPIFIAFAAMVVDRVYFWIMHSRTRVTYALCGAVLLPVGVGNLGEVWGLVRHEISMDGNVTQRELYGVGAATVWQMADDFLSDVAIWPAELYFKVRYGLPMRGYRHALRETYLRNYRSLSWSTRAVDLADPNVANTVRGLIAAYPPGTGYMLAERRGAITFTASWPYATTAVLGLRTAERGTLRVGFGMAFGVRWIGEVQLEPSESAAHSVVQVPDGVFDSGLNELVFEFDGTPGKVLISSIEFNDVSDYPPSY